MLQSFVRVCVFVYVREREKEREREREREREQLCVCVMTQKLLARFSFDATACCRSAFRKMNGRKDRAGHLRCGVK